MPVTVIVVRTHRIILIICFILTAMIAKLNALQSVDQPPDGNSVSSIRNSGILRTNPSVRSYGMGDTQTGRVDDLSSIYFNPAGLSLMRYWEYGFSYADMPSDAHSTAFLLNAPLPLGSLGFQFQGATVRNNVQVKNGLNDEPDRNKYALMSGLAWGLPVYRKIIHAGLGIKWAMSDMRSRPDAVVVADYPLYEKGLYVDLGVAATYDLADLRGFFYWLPRVSAGFNIRNLRPKFGMKDEAAYFSPDYTLGVSLYYNYKFAFNTNFVNRTDEPTRFRFGLELWPIYFLAVRSGFMVSGNNDSLKGIYWGGGIGETIGGSKLSFEYSGSVTSVDEFKKTSEVMQRFAIHQSFDKVFRFTDKKGRNRKIRLAQTYRYNTPFQFAHVMEPDEIIDEATELAEYNPDQSLIDATADNNIQPVNPADDNNTQPADNPVVTPTDNPHPSEPVIRKKAIAVYPFVIQPKEEIPALTELRKNIIMKIAGSKELKAMSEIRYKLTPKKEATESDEKYLNRLCQFHTVSMLVFTIVSVNEADGSIVIQIHFFRKGDKAIGGEMEKSGSKDNIGTQNAAIADEFLMQAASMLKVKID